MDDVDEQQTQDRQLADAYARLQVALAPPSDVAVRVGREVGARRRRRRTTVVAATALVLVGVVGGAVVRSSGGSDDGHVVATDPGAETHGSFTLTQQDGSQVEFQDFTLSCGTNQLGKGDPGRIYLWSPFHREASGKRLTEPYISFEAIADQADGKTYTLPVDDPVGESGYPAMLVFAAEAGTEGEKTRPNEVSSSESGAAGSVKVIHASCDPEPTLELEIDVTLGSEVEEGTAKVVGSYR
jgi:hypothetical protein